MLFYARHQYAQKKVRREWQQLAQHRLELGEQVPVVRIRFLVDFFPLDQRFLAEAGVSYLVSTDQHVVLFDLGFNQQKESPSPLRANLQTLGLQSDKLDGIFISHHHMDHVGGPAYQLRHRLALAQLDPASLERAEIWTPRPPRDALASCRVITQPEILGPGFASSGPLPAHLYFMGMIREQALLVSLAGRGLVLVCGCGHPGVAAMVRFAKELTGQGVYAVIGGFHHIVGRGRNTAQKYLGANQPPWRLPDERGVRWEIEQLRALGVELVAPSAHDSCDQALRIIQDVFGDGYLPVRAGDEIQLTGATDPRRD